MRLMNIIWASLRCELSEIGVRGQKARFASFPETASLFTYSQAGSSSVQ